MDIFAQKLNTSSTISSLSVLGYFFTHLSSFMKRSCAGQKGRCPRRMLRMRLERTIGRFCG
ncbi:hypothetical protein BREVNS_1495 [Brevinematales bacterium NS]|nr:hypothetical protein BREVNS_1495 [Brevinematales bacterium NS]